MRCLFGWLFLTTVGVWAQGGLLTEMRTAMSQTQDFMLNSGWVSCLAFSPDGSKIVTVQWESRKAQAWDALTGRRLQTFVLPGLVGADFSPDGSKVLVIDVNNTAILWDARTFKKLLTLGEGRHDFSSGSFSYDGSKIITTHSGTLPEAVIWDVSTGKSVTRLRGHYGVIMDAHFNPDGTRVVTASNDGTSLIWDTVTGEPLKAMRHPSAVLSAAFNHDGTRVITLSNDMVLVFDPETKEIFQTLDVSVDSRNPYDRALYAALNRKGNPVTVNHYGLVRTWRNPKQIKAIERRYLSRRAEHPKPTRNELAEDRFKLNFFLQTLSQ